MSTAILEGQPKGTDAVPRGGQAPDIVLHGGRVHALDAAGTIAQAMAIGGGKIVALGPDAAIVPLSGPGTRVIDLAGRAVLPGINDAHIHAVWLGARWPELMFETPGESWHAPTLATRAERVAALEKAWAVLAALGITSYTEPGIGPGEDAGATGCFGSDVLDIYAELAGTRRQTARVTLLRLFGYLDGASTLADFRAGLETPLPQADPRWLSIPGVKIFADGIPPMKNAWVRTPYRDGSLGGLMTGTGSEAERLAEFRAMVELAHGRGLQVAVHATGDRTIEEFITIVEALGGSKGLGHYVIHGDLATPGQLARMRAAGIGLDIQPIIAEQTAGWLAAAVRDEVARAAWPLDQMLDPAQRTTLTSDAPVASPDWRKIIAVAGTQLERRGVVVGDAELTTLLRMYTAIPAAQDGALDWKGTLEPGKVADFCVLSGDPYAAGYAGLPDLDVEMTWVDGRLVYARPAP